MVSVTVPCRAHGCLTPAPTPALTSLLYLPVSKLFWNAGFNMKVWCCWTHAASCEASHARCYLQFEIHKRPLTPSWQQCGEVHWEPEQQSPHHVKGLCCHHGKRLSCSLHPSQWVCTNQILSIFTSTSDEHCSAEPWGSLLMIKIKVLWAYKVNGDHNWRGFHQRAAH